MTFVVTVDVTLRVWDGGDVKRPQHGRVVFEERSGFVVDAEISFDDLVDSARRVTLAANGGVGGHLSVAHTGVNLAHAATFGEIVLDIVGEAEAAAWREVCETITTGVRRHMSGHD
jgi:hypothetical protein